MSPHKAKISGSRRELPLYAVSEKNGGYKHGVLPFQEHYRRAKEVMSKIKQKEKLYVDS